MDTVWDDLNSELETNLTTQLQEFLKKAKASIQKLQGEVVANEQKAAKERALMLADIQKERDKLTEERKLMDHTNDLQEQIVKLDIGGHQYTTSTSTLTSQPGMLQAMFSGRYDVKQTSEGRVFIDRDGALFRYVLSYLRDGVLDIEGITARKLRRIRREFEYYNLPLTHPCPSILCVGGMSTQGIAACVDRFDPKSCEWEAMDQLPEPRTSHCVCVVDDTVYCLGGIVGEEASPSVFCLRQETMKWETLTDLTSAICEAGCTVVGGDIFLLGGSHHGLEYGPLRAVKKMAVATGAWTDIQPMAEGRISFGCCAVEGNVYVLGGEGVTGQTLVTVERYSTTSDSWEMMPPLPYAREGIAACALDGCVYVIGGLDGSGNVVAKVERFDPVARTWESVPEMNEGRNAPGVCVHEGCIYVVGGLTDDGDYIANMERWDKATERWEELPGGLETARCSVGLTTLLTYEDFIERQLNRLDIASGSGGSPPGQLIAGKEDEPSSKRRR